MQIMGMHTAHSMIVTFTSLNSCYKFNYRFIPFTPKIIGKKRHLANEKITVILFTNNINVTSSRNYSPLHVSFKMPVSFSGISRTSAELGWNTDQVSCPGNCRNGIQCVRRYQQYLCLPFSTAKLQYMFRLIKQ